MALIIENISGSQLDIDDLGFSLVTGGTADVTLTSEAPVVAGSADSGGDLNALITAGSLVVKDPIGGGNLSTADGIAALRSLNDTNWRLGAGSRIGDLSDVVETALATDEVLQFNGSSWVNIAPGNIGGSGSFQLEWKFSTTTTAADPGSKNFRYNNATPASVTEIYVNDTTNGGADASTLLTVLDAGDKLYIQQTDAADTAILFTVVTVTDNIGWFTIDVTVDDDAGNLPGNNKKCAWVMIFNPGASGDPDQNLWETITSDSGSAVANTTTDTLTIAGGTGISTAVSGDTLTITNDSPNATHTGQVTGSGALALDITAITAQPASGAVIGTDTMLINDGGVLSEVTLTQLDTFFGAAGGDPDQNLWETITSDSGSAVANTTTDTLTIAGGTGISTAVSGDTLTITNDSPNVDQNLWETVTSDSGSAVANTTTDTLTIAGGTGISTAVSGDTLTITNTRVFGDNFQQVESDSESGTTSTTFQNKLTLTTPSLPSGTYRIGYSCETRSNSAAVSVEFQVDLNSGTIIANGSEEPDDSSNVMPNSGFRYETLSGINTIDLDWRVNPAESAGTAYIRRGRIEIWRVS